jgi:lipid A 3-O-deacylase
MDRKYEPNVKCMNWYLKALCGFFMASTICVASKVHAGKDPDYLTVSAGWFDLNRKKDEGAEFRLEYRSNYKLWELKPFATLAVASNGMTFIGAGVLMDAYFGKRWVLTPSFAPTWWRGKTSTLNLGHAVEFRSQMELAYRFDDRSRIGLSISHYSNASLSNNNPGTEALMVNYSMPFATVAGLF